MKMKTYTFTFYVNGQTKTMTKVEPITGSELRSKQNAINFFNCMMEMRYKVPGTANHVNVRG